MRLYLTGLMNYVLINTMKQVINSYIVSLSDIIKGNQAYSTANRIKNIMELINA